MIKNNVTEKETILLEEFKIQDDPMLEIKNVILTNCMEI